MRTDKGAKKVRKQTETFRKHRALGMPALGSLPPGCKKPQGKFGECPIGFYGLDYVGPEVGITDTWEMVQEGARWISFQFFVNGPWLIFSYLWHLVGYFFLFAYGSLDLFTNLTTVLQQVLDKMETTVFGSVYLWVFVIAFAIVVFKFWQGNRKQGYMILFRNIAIIAVASYFLSWVPTFAEKTYQGTTMLADQIMLGLSKVSEEKDGKSAPSAIKTERRSNAKKILDQFNKEMFHKTFLVLQFGSIENGEKYVKEFFAYGKRDGEKRIEWFTGYDTRQNRQIPKRKVHVEHESGQVKKVGNVKEEQAFDMVTAQGFWKRWIFLLFVVVCSSVVVGFIFYYLFKIIKMFFVGLGRALWFAWHLLIAMIKGTRHIRDALFGTLHAFSVQVFLAATLGVVMTFYTVLRDLEVEGGDEIAWLFVYLVRIVLVIAAFAAIWMTQKEINREFQNLFGPMAREPDMKELTQLVGKGAKAALGYVTGGANTALDIGVALMGRPDMVGKGRRRIKNRTLRNIAHAQRKAKQEQTMHPAMKQKGLDPKKAKDRSLFQTLNKGESTDNPFTELQAKMSDGARSVFQTMVQDNYNPLSSDAIATYEKWREELSEITRWNQLPEEQQLVYTPPRGYCLLPPKMPESGSPEALVYKRLGYHRQRQQYDQFADQYIRNQKKQMATARREFDQQPAIKRWLKRKERPGFREITQAEIVHAYQSRNQKGR